MMNTVTSIIVPRPVKGVGIDAELVARFARFDVHTSHPMPFVFSVREIYSSRKLADPSVGLCVSFCCKEAFFKALGEPFHFPDCELCYRAGRLTYDVRLAASLLKDHSLEGARAVVHVSDCGYGEIAVTVYAY